MSSFAIKGHDLVTQAESHLEQKDFKAAMECYFKAADYYLKAISQTSDAETIKTLKLLYTSHTRQAREIQKKLESSLEEVGNKEDKVKEEAGKIEHEKDEGEEEKSTVGKLPEIKNEERHVPFNEASYFHVPDNNSDSDEDKDPFDRFWEEVEKHVSMPLAYAALDLDKPEKQEKKHSKKESSRLVPVEKTRYRSEPTKRSTVNESFMLVNETQTRERKLSSSKSLEEYSMENYHLKQTIDQLSTQLSVATKRCNEVSLENEELRKENEGLLKRLEQMKRINEENLLLKSSIIKFRQDFTKKKGDKTKDVFSSKDVE